MQTLQIHHLTWWNVTYFCIYRINYVAFIDATLSYAFIFHMNIFLKQNNGRFHLWLGISLSVQFVHLSRLIARDEISSRHDKTSHKINVYIHPIIIISLFIWAKWKRMKNNKRQNHSPPLCEHWIFFCHRHCFIFIRRESFVCWLAFKLSRISLNRFIRIILWREKNTSKHAHWNGKAQLSYIKNQREAYTILQ